MRILKPKIPTLGKFWRALKGKGGYILRPFGIYVRPFGILYGHLVYFLPFWYIVSRKIWQPCTQVLERKAKIQRILIQNLKSFDFSLRNGKKETKTPNLGKFWWALQ
jgi:hypothetical protein